MLLLFSIERMAAHPVFQSLRLITGSTLTPALIRLLSAMLPTSSFPIPPTIVTFRQSRESSTAVFAAEPPLAHT
jgi:hypothetical protein